ncbi:MAG TPA: toll/interleukin-1 receptor domain-containing protein, partial [Stenomitos sp.]
MQTAQYDLFISYADADSGWVEGYLLDSLKQAGVRYHSEAAFALGTVRLLEFERAIEQSDRTLLVLSPAYLADGFNQFIDLLAQCYGFDLATWPVIPLVLQSVKLPPRLNALVKLSATNPTEWEEATRRLCADLKQPVPVTSPKR